MNIISFEKHNYARNRDKKSQQFQDFHFLSFAFSVFLHGLSPSPLPSAASSSFVSGAEYIFCSVPIDAHGSRNGVENIVSLNGVKIVVQALKTFL